MSSWSQGLSGDRFDKVFPFFLELDAAMCVRACGSSLERICEGISLGDALSDHFEVERPNLIELTIDTVEHAQRTPFVLRHKHSDLKLRGQVSVGEDRSTALFLGLPWVTSVSEIRQNGIRLSDFPVHTPLADLIFVIQNQNNSLAEARGLAARLRRNQQVLARAKEDAESAAVAKDAFLANISHEIRTPLNGITGLTQLLAGTQLDEGQRELSTLIEKSTKSLLSVLEDVLELARIRSGHIESNTAPFHLGDFLSEAVDMYSGAARAKGIRIGLLEPDDLPVRVQGDVGRLRQVLNNLLGNAVKFTEQGQVILEASMEREEAEPEGTLELRVTDTGVGIPADSLESIFDEFVQVDESATRRFGGSGLGLAICRRLVTLMSGTIEAQSVEGEGATFRMRVPIRVIEPGNVVERPEADVDAVKGPVEMLESRPAGDVQEPSSNGRPQDPATQTRLAPPDTRLLVVEDNAVNQLVAKRLLTKLGYVVDTAADGLEAVNSVRAQEYDLILMDLQMPRMDGFEATRRIRSMGEAGARVPIVALTANALPEHRDRCLADGMDDFVSKPFDFQALADTIARRIGSRGPIESNANG